MVKRVQWGLRWTELIKLWSKMVEVTVTMAVMFGGVVKRGGDEEKNRRWPYLLDKMDNSAPEEDCCAEGSCEGMNAEQVLLYAFHGNLGNPASNGLVRGRFEMVPRKKRRRWSS